MSKRRVQIVLLCEDDQHEAFGRRFLEGVGWTSRQLRVEKAASAEGAAEQWVRERYPLEVRTLRSSSVTRALIVMVDADTRTYEKRVRELDDVLQADGQNVRGPAEPFAVVAPRRNIETWIAYLQGHDVDERQEYPKLRRPRDCGPAVKALKAMCDSGTLRAPCRRRCGRRARNIRRASSECSRRDPREAGRSFSSGCSG